MMNSRENVSVISQFLKSKEPLTKQEKAAEKRNKTRKHL